MIEEGRLYKNRDLGNVVRVISASDTRVELEDIETYEIMELSIYTFESEFKEC